jgi:hypothetical protein
MQEKQVKDVFMIKWTGRHTRKRKKAFINILEE